MSHPSNITRSQTLRVVADLVDLAENNGSTIEPNVSVYTAGWAQVNICATGGRKPSEVPHRDVTAWQLATGSVWDVSTVRYETDGEPRVIRSCDVVYQGVRVAISMISAEVAVAA